LLSFLKTYTIATVQRQIRKFLSTFRITSQIARYTELHSHLFLAAAPPGIAVPTSSAIID